MLFARICVCLVLEVALIGALRPDKKHAKEAVKFIRPGVPVLGYSSAHEGRSLPELSDADPAQAHWMVFLDKNTSVAEVRRLCDSTQACEMDGVSSEQDMRFLQLRGTEHDLSSLVRLAGDQVRLVRAGRFRMRPPSALEQDQSPPDENSMLHNVIAHASLSWDTFGPEDFSVLTSAGLVVGVIAIAIAINVMETFYNAADGVRSGRKTYVISKVWSKALRPILVIFAFLVHTTWLYDLVLVRNWNNLQNIATEILLGMSFAWWFVTYLQEVCVKCPRICGHKDDFIACDVYTDLTDTMFNVTVRFLTQGCMMIILVEVIKTQVALGSPRGITPIRSVLNFCIALTLELYLFVASRGRSRWQDLRRLQNVRAIAHLDLVTNADNGPKQITEVSRSQFYLRFGMSIMVSGIFHKFLILSYPVLVFTCFARDDWMTILKDILAVTIVIELDSLSRPRPFLTLTESEADMEDEPSDLPDDLGTASAAMMNLRTLRATMRQEEVRATMRQEGC